MSRSYPHLIATLAVAAVLCAGCGGGSFSDVVSPPAQTVSSTVAVPSAVEVTVTHTAASRVPKDVTSLEISARDASDAVVFGPVSVPFASSVSLSVSANAETLDIGYVAPRGKVAHFARTVALDQGRVDIVDPPLVETADAAVYSFVFFGCNRVSGKDAGSSNPSTANVAQLVRDFHEVVDARHFASTVLPSVVLLVGDLVENLEKASDGTLKSQLKAWRKLYETTDLGQTSVPVAAVAGNHEFLYKDKSDSDAEVPDPDAGPVWTHEMAQFILNNDGPVVGGPDPVQRDESTLSFTYTDATRGIMWIMLDTDTYEGGSAVSDTGLVPLAWVQSKLAAANTNPAIQHIFVLGHRPIDSPEADNPGVNPAQAAQLYTLLNNPNGNGTPTKVRAYLCAHAHRWQSSVLSHMLATATVPQIICGNGGSEPAGSFKHPYLGYTEIDVMASGAVSLVSWGRPVPKPYYSSDKQPDTTVREQQTIYTPSTAKM